ncbi:gamma-glutamylcyclotransferase family protein [Geoalkalibacter halelectricus]|uniref:Gamma-glutamylcyclotransferase n=1 Tax=Geoalkalibacter halelectricus TaxID=2847045 RepID=A0ABY5ZHL3_9BACT|nr:gamma-glutamylcyclotransferase family protein [Geoalkalibacter halelectricus]MDO3378226.1 gamma-glutamylcyclotransferase [Geoalkalibacter halelectricus]UWZ78068.1 gamma-glutamylcyclotransferase [Geoalkalibacter halelectricus]
MLYFAYGHNMDPDILAQRGVAFERVCTGKVRGVRLVFHKPGADGTGKADLQDHRGSVVEGVVYEVPEESLANLDVYEGVDKGHYRRQLVKVQTFKGELECVVYRAAKFKSGLKPSRAYLDALIRGAERHGLSEEYQVFLKSHATMG